MKSMGPEAEVSKRGGGLWGCDGTIICGLLSVCYCVCVCVFEFYMVCVICVSYVRFACLMNLLRRALPSTPKISEE